MQFHPVLCIPVTFSNAGVDAHARCQCISYFYFYKYFFGAFALRLLYST